MTLAFPHPTRMAAETVVSGNAYLGIEFGSTRIKTVLIDAEAHALASGQYEWENQLVDGLWSYASEMIVTGMQESYASLADDVRRRYGVSVESIRGFGISAMMHGYLALDAHGALLVPFRTWRNTNTEAAVRILSEALSFAVPHRWSAAHLFQAVIDNEPHLGRLDHITTLAGLVHEKLTGRRVMGVGMHPGCFRSTRPQMVLINAGLMFSIHFLLKKGFNGVSAMFSRKFWLLALPLDS